MTLKKEVMREVDGAARRLAKTLLRTARYGAIGTLDSTDGTPFVSRIALACAMTGAPVFLISQLSSHFTNLEHDARCSVLVGEPGKGDPLAHPRMTILGRARKVTDAREREGISRRYLARHPKAALYAGFSDFAFWTIDVDRASLNGGFGKAYALTANDICQSAMADLEALEPDAVAHMNSDHVTAVQRYAHMAGGEGEGWRLACIDPEGLDLVRGDEIMRLWFGTPLQSAEQLRSTLRSMVEQG